MMTSTSEIPSDLGSTLAGYSVKELHQHYQSLMDLLKSNATNSSGRRKMSLLRPKEPHFDQEGEQLYCSCQQPDDCSFMIQCDTCKEWYHGRCIGLIPREGEKLELYICSDCECFIKDLISNRGKFDPATEEGEDDYSEKTVKEAETPKPSQEASIDRQSKKPKRESLSLVSPAEKRTSISSETHSSSISKDLRSLRLVALKGFTETFKIMFQEAEETKEYTIDLKEWELFAKKLERELHQAVKVAVGLGSSEEQKEKVKYRSLQFNLKDKNNLRLRKRILMGEWDAQKLAGLSPEEMANEQVRELAAEVRKQSIQQVVKVQESEQGTSQLDILYPQGYDATLNVNSNHIMIQQEITETPVESVDSFSHFPQDSHVDEGAELTMSIKRSGDEENGDSVEKRRRTDSSTHLQTEFQHNPFISEGRYDFSAMDEPYIMSPQTPPGSPPQDYFNVEQEVVWSGKVIMPQVAKLNCECRQIAGNPLGSARIWEDVLPTSISIDGRIATDKVAEYVLAQKLSSSKEVVLVEFSPQLTRQTEDFTSEAIQELNAKEKIEYQGLFDYFYSRKRSAVVGHHYVSVKDMYIVPLAASDDIPEFLSSVTENKIHTNRICDRLLGIIILIKKVVRGRKPSRLEKRTESTQHESEASISLVEPSTTEMDIPFSVHPRELNFMAQPGDMLSAYPIEMNQPIDFSAVNHPMDFPPLNHPNVFPPMNHPIEMNHLSQIEPVPIVHTPANLPIHLPLAFPANMTITNPILNTNFDSLQSLLNQIQQKSQNQ